MERQKRMAAPLSSELRAKYEGVRSLSVRKGDKVRVVRGASKKKEGKVTGVYRKKYALEIEGVVRHKANQQQVFIGTHPSNVLITEVAAQRHGKDGEPTGELARRMAGRLAYKEKQKSSAAAK